jgi:2-polyprenyl-3-methyl-5-hydroxy-6-metoxy-1,4-benzoquinol methylase
MTNEFDKDYWEQHWRQTISGAPAAMDGNPPNPYLVRGTSSLTPGTALDAGCGAGTEAIWLATQGWQVTAADISPDALNRAIRRATDSGVSQQVRWIEADLTVWNPDNAQFDLVTTHYAHPAMAQLAFYDRVSTWVAPGGTLLIVGHLHTHESTEHEHHGQHPPAEASVTVADISADLDDTRWEIVTAEEHLRTLTGPAGQAVDLRDVVVQATRRS